MLRHLPILLFLGAFLPLLSLASDCSHNFDVLSLHLNPEEHALYQKLQFDSGTALRRFIQQSYTWRRSQALSKEMKKLSKPNQDVYREVIDIMNDSHKLGNFLLSLREEALQKMAAKDPALLQEFQRTQQIPRTIMLEIFAERAKKQGWNKIVELPSRLISKEAFFNYIARGEIFTDPAFRGQKRGEWVHVLQMLYIAENVNPKFGSKAAKEFFQEIGRKQIIWLDHFDHSYARKWNNPKVLSPGMRGVLPVQE